VGKRRIEKYLVSLFSLALFGPTIAKTYFSEPPRERPEE